MFKSLLNANSISIDSLILSVFIILAVVVAGAVIIYLLWEVVGTYVNKNKTEEKHDEVAQQQNTFVANYNIDKEKQDEVVVLDEQKLEDVDEEKAEEEKEEAQEQIVAEEKENAERRAYLEERRQELIRRMQAEMEESNAETPEPESNQETSEPESNEEDEDELEQRRQELIRKMQAQMEETNVEEPAEHEEETHDEEADEDSKTKADELEEERRKLQEEKDKYEAMYKELEAAKRALNEQPAPEPIKIVETVVETKNLSLEELKERLANAEERLRDTEKEFKQCKKEYIPLRRVWTSYEKDAKKLRRKEALVAKQKVLLYGVNNYADIDAERAKKLAEDLDLLDGLKLSVQHCEEVMKENEERYPLLERMYGVLKQRNDELKNDIAKYRAEIAKLEAEEANN